MVQRCSRGLVEQRHVVISIRLGHSCCAVADPNYIECSVHFHAHYFKHGSDTEACRKFFLSSLFGIPIHSIDKTMRESIWRPRIYAVCPAPCSFVTFLISCRALFLTLSILLPSPSSLFPWFYPFFSYHNFFR